MLIYQADVQESLRRVVGSITKDPDLQDDLLQEAFIHLWKTEKDKPSHKLSWYIQSCWFHLHHCLASGRSVDSPKRSRGDNRLLIEGCNLPHFHTNGENFERVSFRDLLHRLRSLLPPREVAVLEGLAIGMEMREICETMRISYPTLLKYRRHIASILRKLEGNPPPEKRSKASSKATGALFAQSDPPLASSLSARGLTPKKAPANGSLSFRMHFPPSGT